MVIKNLLNHKVLLLPVLVNNTTTCSRILLGCRAYQFKAGKNAEMENVKINQYYGKASKQDFKIT